MAPCRGGGANRCCDRRVAGIRPTHTFLSVTSCNGHTFFAKVRCVGDSFTSDCVIAIGCSIVGPIDDGTTAISRAIGRDASHSGATGRVLLGPFISTVAAHHGTDRPRQNSL